MSARASSDAQWEAYAEAAARITARIDPNPGRDGSPRAVRERAGRKLSVLQSFLRELGSPELALPVIHVTGTSGKGSTAAAIASLLQSAGMRTGLATSPYLQVMSEKLQVDGQLISGAGLLAALREVEDAEARWVAAGNAPLAYGQLWTALMLRWFAAEGVDAAVIEVGAGGRFDLTNVVSPVACVITSVGLDHLQTLGPTLADIAWHKAGIIKPGAAVVTGPLPPEGETAVAAEVASTGAAWTLADDRQENSGDLPKFARRNQQLALATVSALASRGFIDGKRIDNRAIGQVRLPGRLEAMPGNSPRVILDGAHNPDKIRALASELQRRRSEGGAPPVILFAALGAKDAGAALTALAPEASRFVFTEAPVLGKAAMPAPALEELARQTGIPAPSTVMPNLQDALDSAARLALETGVDVLATGSLYLLGPVRRRWHPDREVVIQRTPWPSPVKVSDVENSGADRR